MKNSTKFILLTVLIILGCVTAYNFKLKAMYESKSYRNPYAGMEFTPISPFKKLNLKSKYNTTINVEQSGKEGVWIDRRIRNKVKISVHGGTLNIEINGSKSQNYEGSIIVLAKTISDLNVNHNEFKNGDYFQGEVIVKKYNLDKLNLQLSGSVKVQLENVKIDTLDATVGQNIGYSVLDLSNVQVNVADYDIGIRGRLTLSGADIRVNNNREDSKSASFSK